MRRQRSHTSVQLERLQRNMIKSANVRHIKWELTPVSLTGILNNINYNLCIWNVPSVNCYVVDWFKVNSLRPEWDFVWLTFAYW